MEPARITAKAPEIGTDPSEQEEPSATLTEPSTRVGYPLSETTVVAVNAVGPETNVENEEFRPLFRIPATRSMVDEGCKSVTRLDEQSPISVA